MSDSLARTRLARAAIRLARRSAPPLPSLVLMTDDLRLDDPLAAAMALPRGAMVIVRARDPVRRDFLARTLLKTARRRGLAVLVAGDPGLALRLGADGVHLAEIRAGESAAWRARGASLLITASAHSLRAVVRAKALPIDAVFLSPVFDSASHPDAPTLGAVRANLIARAFRIPVYALGGIDARNAVRLAENTFAGIAAIGALRA